MLTHPEEKATPGVAHSPPALSTRQPLRQEQGAPSHPSPCLQRPHPSHSNTTMGRQCFLATGSLWSLML